ncbi:polysaccharide biosynthesis/export family protein [bacterium]|nr:polysaccharide biosynthesis/export family protein [candidate division CSSED10-310 bacterium]
MKLSVRLLIFSLLVVSNPICYSLDEEIPYRIGSGDQLRITIIGRHDYKVQEELKVKESGEILPSIMKKSFHVAGLTLAEVDQILTGILAEDYIVDPEVMVEISQYNSHKVLVIGEVRHPGEVVLESETLAIKDLVIRLGGPVGDLNKTLVVIRAETAGDPEILQLDQVLMDSSINPVSVRSNDIVYIVSKTKDLPLNDLDSVVYVFGQIANPGLLPYSNNLTALTAILNAGNFTREAAPGRTVVKRRKDGEIHTINVDLNEVMSGGDKSKDIPVLPGDIIYVPRAIF